jgi:hypothetical protein
MRRILFTLLLALTASACSAPELPSLPGLPEELRQIPDALRGIELPDLSGIDLPGLDALPAIQTPPGGIVYNGPTERSLEPGERIPGTDITFVEVRDGQAIFSIGGMQAPRRNGDSLDYDGSWPGVDGSSYHARLRLYRTGTDSVRVAGVHQLMLPAIAPALGAKGSGSELTFPFIDGVETGGDTIAGTTYGYLGRYERGAQLAGVPDNLYPYRSVGDSIEWEGSLRPGVGVDYDLRVIVYGVEGLRVGGTVTVVLPAD